MRNKKMFLTRTFAFLAAGSLAVSSYPTAVFADGVTVQVAQTQDQESTQEYTYVYAGISWADYWKSEGVYCSGDLTAKNDKVDARNEKDRGAFDVVSRATVNHGLHRGSYQCLATIYGDDKNKYEVSHWSADGKTLYLTDGREVGYNKGVLTVGDKTVKLEHYEVTGIKYVPVKVKTADYAEFCKKYPVTENGKALVGGYGEGSLKSYEETANVTEKTNGLKTVTKNADGTFTFSARAKGTDSGLKDKSLQKIDSKNITVTVKPGDGDYGEFLRVDLTGADYGKIGEKMQAVRWDYYGNDASRKTALASYGTKFAADNWMHKAMGVQLGLTDSFRCQLPKDTYGTGYWTLTIYGLGNEDYVVNFEAKAENIADDNVDAIEKNYVLMNIPYAQYYKNEQGKNTVDADIVSSATKNKTRNSGLVNGSYHEKADGSEITGVTYPVKLGLGVTYADLAKFKEITDKDSVEITTELKGQKKTETFTGKEALFENASYAYYKLKEEPSYYKVLTKDANGNLSFSEVKGTESDIKDAKVTFKSTSKYGDYQLNVDSETLKGTTDDPVTVYGAVLTTEDGYQYGLRHLENIWRNTELAWCVGYTTSVKGCPTNSKSYESMIGKTLTNVTYYTNKGTLNLKLDTPIVLPKKFKCDLTVKDAVVTDGKTSVSLGKLPEGYDPEYSVEKLEGATATATEITFPATTKAGRYNYVVHDKKGVYADLSVTFNITEPAQQPNTNQPSASQPSTGQPAGNQQTNQTTTDASKTTTTAAAIKKGETFVVKGVRYKVTNARKGKESIAAIGLVKKTAKSLVIPNQVTWKKKTLKVTSIGAKAFTNVKNLRKVTIGANVTVIGKQAFAKNKALSTIIVKSKNLKTVGTAALKSGSKKVTVKVSAAKVKVYKKLLKKQGKTVIVKK